LKFLKLKQQENISTKPLARKNIFQNNLSF